MQTAAMLCDTAGSLIALDQFALGSDSAYNELQR